MTAPQPGYTYRAVVRRWVDADTVRLDVDLGIYQWRHDLEVRLLGVNAPDKNPAKRDASWFVRDLMPIGARCVVQTVQDEDDKYGRMLGHVWLGDLYVNEHIIDAGHGMPYAGGKRPEDY